jgi:hypothetical protein
MLKVILDVNGLKIGEFKILNIGNKGLEKRKGQWRNYKVEYFEDEKGKGISFQIKHKREDRALVLLQKVLKKTIKEK